jgi:hypothetical protein
MFHRKPAFVAHLADLQIEGVPTHASTQVQTSPARKISPVISHEDMWANKTA